MSLVEEINAQALIHGVPDEILGEIFSINTFKLVKQGNEKDSYDPLATTLASAQVCQRWRVVALGYPSLWSRIIDYERHSPLCIETLLERSGSSPFDVGSDSVYEPVQLRNPRGKPILESIFQRITRLKTLNLNIRRAPWEYICCSFLGQPAHNLEFLNLITSCPFPDCLYPDPLFADEAPCLRRLHLQRCFIDFSSSVLSNLTALSVRDILAPHALVTSAQSHPSRAAPSVAGWLRVLQNIPALRFLTLSSAISHFTEQGPLPVVDLPELVLLTISARFYQGVTLIDHLKIPPSCGLRFRLIRSRSTDGLDSPNLLSFLSHHLSNWPQDYSDRYLQAKVLSGDRIHFGNSKRVGQVLDMNDSDEVEAHSRCSLDPMLLLVLTFDSSENTFSFFNQLLEMYSFTFSTTTTFELWLDEEFADTVMTGGSFPSLHTFHSFTNLKTLNLLEQSPLYLLPLFQNSSLPGFPLFPALQSLCLTAANIDDGQGAVSSEFVAFLLWRIEAQVPLPEINILGGHMHGSKQAVEDLLRQFGNLRLTLDMLAGHPLKPYPF